MTYSEVIYQFENDLEHLLWRSEVHRLSSGEINSYFIELKNNYAQLVGEADQGELQGVINRWGPIVAKTAVRHKGYPNTGIKPRP